MLTATPQMSAKPPPPPKNEATIPDHHHRQEDQRIRESMRQHPTARATDRRVRGIKIQTKKMRVNKKL